MKKEQNVRRHPPFLFGFSFLDIAIGAFDSNRSFIFKCIPTAKVNVDIQINNTLLNMNTTEFYVRLCIYVERINNWNKEKMLILGKIYDSIINLYHENYFFIRRYNCIKLYKITNFFLNDTYYFKTKANFSIFTNYSILCFES